MSHAEYFFAKLSNVMQLRHPGSSFVRAYTAYGFQSRRVLSTFSELLNHHRIKPDIPVSILVESQELGIEVAFSAWHTHLGVMPKTAETPEGALFGLMEHLIWARQSFAHFRETLETSNCLPAGEVKIAHMVIISKSQAGTAPVSFRSRLLELFKYHQMLFTPSSVRLAQTTYSLVLSTTEDAAGMLSCLDSPLQSARTHIKVHRKTFRHGRIMEDEDNRMRVLNTAIDRSETC
jgi:hypothetical protein